MLVPEIYKWHTDKDEVFLYIEVISSRTLEQAQGKIGINNRFSIYHNIQIIFNNLRQLKQDPLDIFINKIPFFYLVTYSIRAKIIYIGNITQSPLYDKAINPKYISKLGPFTSVKNFHNQFTFLYQQLILNLHAIPLKPFL